MTSALEAFTTGLTGQYGADHVAVDTPADLDQHLPFHRPRRISGSDGSYPYDEAVLDVDTFGPDMLTALNAAELVRRWVRLTLPGTTVAGVYINGTSTVLAPVWTPWDNTNMRRVTATYRIALH